MEKQKLDALLVTAESNYSYFTGYRSEQNRNDKIRQYVFLLPLESDPVIFVMPYERGDVKLTTWIEGVRTYELFRHNEVLEQTIREFGLAKARIGCELGREQYLNLSYNDFNNLRARLQEASFVDASQIFLALRAIKSPAEIERCRAAAETAARTLDRVFGLVKPGMNNLDVARLARQLIIEEGAEKQVFLTVTSGLDFTKSFISGMSTVPTPRIIEKGDTLTVDTGAEIGGYSSDVCRVAVVGRASQKQKDLYRQMIELHRTCFEFLRPGNTCEEVALLCQRELVTRDILRNSEQQHQSARPTHDPRTVGRIGHGVGREATEFPSIRPGEEVRIEPGMVFTLNPSFVTEFGLFNSEENLLVTEQGYQLLSQPASARELRVLG